jgi:hypothetical protein
MTLSSVPPAKSDGGLTRKRKRQQSPHAAKKKKVAADRTSSDAAEKNVAKMMDLFVRKITDVVDAAAQECMETLTDVICEKLEAVEKTRQVDADTIIYMLQELDNNSSSSLTSDPVDFPAREIKTRRTPRSKGQKQQQQAAAAAAAAAAAGGALSGFRSTCGGQEAHETERRKEEEEEDWAAAAAAAATTTEGCGKEGFRCWQQHAQGRRRRRRRWRTA